MRKHGSSAFKTSVSNPFRICEMQDYTDLKLDLAPAMPDDETAIMHHLQCVKSPSIVTAKMKAPTSMMNQISYRSIYNTGLKQSHRELGAIREGPKTKREVQPRLPNASIQPPYSVLQADTQSQEKILDILKNTDYEGILNHDASCQSYPATDPISPARTDGHDHAVGCTCSFRHAARARLHASVNTDYHAKQGHILNRS